MHVLDSEWIYLLLFFLGILWSRHQLACLPISHYFLKYKLLVGVVPNSVFGCLHKDIGDDVVITCENFDCNVSNRFHILILVHGCFDADSDHLLGEVSIFEQIVHKKLQFSFDFL